MHASVPVRCGQAWERDAAEQRECVCIQEESCGGCVQCGLGGKDWTLRVIKCMRFTPLTEKLFIEHVLCAVPYSKHLE